MEREPNKTERTTGTVFIVAATHWVRTARLAMSLAALGCRVELMSPRRHPAMCTGAVARWHAYIPFDPLQTLRRAINRSRPDLLLFADEIGCRLIGDLLASLGAGAEASAATRAEHDHLEQLLVRSFGRVETFHLACSRVGMLREAEAAGVRVSESFTIDGSAAAVSLPDRLPGPWILKADAGWGAWGVREVSAPSALLPTWRLLHNSLTLPRSLFRCWLSGDWGHLRNGLKPQTREVREVIAQRRIRGQEFTGMAVAVDGQLSAAACLEVVTPGDRHGPSAVVRVLDDAAMTRAMAAVVGRLRLSGFCGFDFVREEATADLLLEEVNARPAQLAHLPMGPGRDMTVAFLRDLLGRDEIDDRASEPTTDLIALFPQEVRRDPLGETARRAFHDVPWNAPELIRRCAEMLPGRTLPKWLAADKRLASPVYLMTPGS